jgi:hypothetical protein
MCSLLRYAPWIKTFCLQNLGFDIAHDHTLKIFYSLWVQSWDLYLRLAWNPLAELLAFRKLLGQQCYDVKSTRLSYLVPITLRPIPVVL